MRLLVALLTVAAAVTCLAADQPQQLQTQQQPHSGQQHQPLQGAASSQQAGQQAANKQQQPAAAAALSQLGANERQGRSIASGGSLSGNQLQSGNSIDYSILGSSSSNSNSQKARIETEKREVREFLSQKNIFRQIIKLIFGNPDEVTATSRNVLGMLSKVLDILKGSFGVKSRSTGSRTFKDSAEEVGSAAVSMLQGYVKSQIAKDGTDCAKRYLCQASREAIRDGRELGYVIATVGGYATSYLLDSGRDNESFHELYAASNAGRKNKDDCAKIYPQCNGGAE